MATEGRGIVGPNLRLMFNLLLYLLVGAQFIVLLRQVQRWNPMHLFSFDFFTLPLMFFSPFGIGLGFLGTIRRAERDHLLSEKMANLCRDWMTVLLTVVYAIMFQFRPWR